jgi:ferredoxin--NADP+ reductase
MAHVLFFNESGYIPAMLNSTVAGRIDLTPELMILQVKPDVGVPSFVPGQYVALGLPGSAPRFAGAEPEPEAPAPDKLIKRAYSISSSPNQREFLEFYIAVVPSGSLTSRLAMVQPGDRVFTQPKVTGTFTLDGIPEDRNLVLVSTGTGLAPFMSMVRTEGTWLGGRKITIVHGVRFPEDFAYVDELSSIGAGNSNFQYLPISSRAPEGWQGRKGRVQRLFEDGTLALDSARDHVFLCGNPGMIEDLEKLLGGVGYTQHSKKTPGNLSVEKYW